MRVTLNGIQMSLQMLGRDKKMARASRLAILLLVLVRSFAVNVDVAQISLTNNGWGS